MPPAQSSRKSKSATAGSNAPLNNRTIANMSRRRANAIANAARASSRSPVNGSSSPATMAEHGSMELGMFLCQWGDCNRRFHVLGDYANHVNDDHCRPVNRSGPGKKCDWAGCWRQDRFTSINQLMCHVRAHTGEKPFKCTLCDLRFSVRSNYNAHVKTRHNKPNLEPEIVDYDPATEPHPSNSISTSNAAGDVPAMRRTSTGQLALLDSPSAKKKAAVGGSSIKRKSSAASAAAALLATNKATRKTDLARQLEKDDGDETSSEDDGETLSSASAKKKLSTVRVAEDILAPLSRQARRQVVSYEETTSDDNDDAVGNAAAMSDSDIEDPRMDECTSLSGRPRIGFQTSAKDDQDYGARSSTVSKRVRKLSQPSNSSAPILARGLRKRTGKQSPLPTRLDLSSAHKLTASRMNHGDSTADSSVPGAPPTPPPSATFNSAKRSPAGTTNKAQVGTSPRRGSLAPTLGRRDSISSRRNSIIATKKTASMKCAHRAVVKPELATVGQCKTILAELEHRLKYLQMVEIEVTDARARLGLSAPALDPAVDAQLSSLRMHIRSVQDMLCEHLLPVTQPRDTHASTSMSESISPPLSAQGPIVDVRGCVTPDNTVPAHLAVQRLAHPNAHTTTAPPSCSSSIQTLYTTPPLTPSLDALAGSCMEQTLSPAAL